MKKERHKKRPSSTRIEAARDKIYKANDPVRLAMIFFPKRDAREMRTTFLAIYYEIRKARNKRIATLNHIPSKYEINMTCFLKARSKMARLGLITKYGGYWTFSDRFQYALLDLIKKVSELEIPPSTIDEENMELTFIASAKREIVPEQLRIRRDDTEDDD